MYSVPASTRSVQPMSTTAKAAFAVIGTVLIGTGSVYGLDRTESWRHHVQPRVPFVLDAVAASIDNTERPDVRTVPEHIENIRNVLNPPIADLAALFEVSRQSIYKWLAGSSIPENDKLGRIRELSQIADVFQSAGIARTDSLLKMKTFGERSLMDLIKSGDNRHEHVAALIAEAKVMESSYNQSGLLTTKSKPTSDWQSSISIPGSPERA